MAEPLTGLGALATKYAPTVVGLAIGTAAKYGLTLSEGKRPTWLGILADMLLLGILGLIAIQIGNVAERLTGWAMTNDMRVLVSSLAAVSSDRLVRLARDRFINKVDADLLGAIKATDGVATVPAGPAAPTVAPTTAKLTVFRNADPRTAGIETLAEGPLPKTGADFNELLSKLD